MNRTNPEFQTRIGVALVFDFSARILLLTSQFASCYIPPSRDNCHEASYSRMQQRGMGES